MARTRSATRQRRLAERLTKAQRIGDTYREIYSAGSAHRTFAQWMSIRRRLAVSVARSSGASSLPRFALYRRVVLHCAGGSASMGGYFVPGIHNWVSALPGRVQKIHCPEG